MQDLRQPWLYEQFATRRFHSIRQSDRFWAGLSSDFVIEQVQMKSIKSRAGVHRGREVKEGVRKVWVKSMHACAGIHLAMKSVTSLTSREEHADVESSHAKTNSLWSLLY